MKRKLIAELKCGDEFKLRRANSHTWYVVMSPFNGDEKDMVTYRNLITDYPDRAHYSAEPSTIVFTKE